jgi:TonB-linked SusC/RagA family outer membrane protein
MKTKLHWIFACVLLLSTFIVSAQEKTVTGIVTDNNGIPLPGVNIFIKNTSTGTQTDFDGNFTLRVQSGKTIVFSYVGFKTQEIAVTESVSNLEITMAEDAALLDEVVVTALGIKKERKALGYAITSLDSRDVEQRANGDINRILQGKAAGVNVVNASGLSGAGSSVNIRGLVSFGDNQPLYVVDGVRFNTSTNGSGLLSTSRAFDIDPNTIESVDILKGLSASTLYGEDGRNGVVIITTKAGSVGGNRNKKMEVSLTLSTFVNEIASLPDYTNQRGQGYYDAFYNFFGNWGATFGRTDFGNVDSQGQVPHPYALNSPVFRDAFPDITRADYRDYRSQENFFGQGVVQNISASVSGGDQNAGYNMTVGHLDDEGFLPGNSVQRNTLSVGGNANLTNKFSFTSSLNYTNTKFTAPFTGPLFTGLLNTPKSVDLAGFPSQHPVTGEEINFQNSEQAANPYWFVNNTFANQNVDRIFAQVGANYEFTDWLTASYKFGMDISSINATSGQNIGAAGTNNDDQGSYTSDVRRQELNTHTFLLNIDKRFGADDNFGVTANIGAEAVRRTETRTVTSSTIQTVFNKFEHQFFEETDATSRRYERNIVGVLGQATLDYKNQLFLNLSARNDWVSNFVDNDQFYPGVGLSWIATETLEGLQSDAIGFLKLRANYGSSANYNVPGTSFFGNFIPYPIQQAFASDANSFVGINGQTVGTDFITNSLSNPAVGPALIEEYELGIEGRFWNNRVNFDVSYFNRITSDLIFNQQLDPSTGFTSGPRNVNEFEFYGVELQMDVKVIDNDELQWTVGGNFTANESEMTKLNEEFFVVTEFGSVANVLIEGEPINMIFGNVIATDEDGNFLTNGRQYEIAEERQVIGDPNPDWIGSFFTSLNYKGFTLAANLQYTQGGDIHSDTARSLLGRGLTSDTDGLQNAGYVLPGINTITGEPNDVIISAGDSFFNEYTNGPDQFGIFDASVFRIQEASLTYNFSKKMLEKTPFGQFSIAFVGENLYFDAINIPDGLNIDPNVIGTGVNSNGAGIETGVSPSSRRYGISVRASF